MWVPPFVFVVVWLGGGILHSPMFRCKPIEEAKVWPGCQAGDTRGLIETHCPSAVRVSARGLRATTRAGVCLLHSWPCQRSLTACQPAALTAVALGEGNDVGGLVWDPSAAQLSTNSSHGPACCCCCLPPQPFPALPDSPLSPQPNPTLRSHGCQQRVLLSGAQFED